MIICDCSCITSEEITLVKSKVGFAGYIFFICIKINSTINMFICVSPKVILNHSQGHTYCTRGHGGEERMGRPRISPCRPSTPCVTVDK